MSVPKRAVIGSWVRVLLTLPWSLVGWLLGGLLCLTRLAQWRAFVLWNPDTWEADCTMRLETGPWLAARWRYSTTLGRTILLNSQHCVDGATFHRIMYHEMVHVWQVEVNMLAAAVLAAAVSPWLGWGSLLVWLSGGAWQAAGWAQAWLQGGDAYRDSEHERSAYCQAEQHERRQAWHYAQGLVRQMGLTLEGGIGDCFGEPDV